MHKLGNKINEYTDRKSSTKPQREKKMTEINRVSTLLKTNRNFISEITWSATIKVKTNNKIAKLFTSVKKFFFNLKMKEKTLLDINDRLVVW